MAKAGKKNSKQVKADTTATGAAGTTGSIPATPAAPVSFIMSAPTMMPIGLTTQVPLIRLVNQSWSQGECKCSE